MSKHTPGPWTLQGDGCVGIRIVSTGGAWICQFWDKREEDFDNAEANAHLIAAAPDMLAVCEKLAEADKFALPDGSLYMEYIDLVAEARDMARAAMKRVREER